MPQTARYLLSLKGRQRSSTMAQYPTPPPPALSFTQAHLCDTPLGNLSCDNCAISHKNEHKRVLRYYRHKHRAMWNSERYRCCASKVNSNAALVHGTSEIRRLLDLEPGEVHEARQCNDSLEPPPPHSKWICSRRNASELRRCFPKNISRLFLTSKGYLLIFGLFWKSLNMHCKTRIKWPHSGLSFDLFFWGYFNLFRLLPKNNLQRFLGFVHLQIVETFLFFSRLNCWILP